MNFGIGILIALVLVLVMAISSNQMMFAFVILLCAMVGLVMWLYSQQQPKFKPYSELQTRIASECFNPNNELGYLVLSGDLKHQERVRGKISGYTKLELEDTKDKAWKNVYVFKYELGGKSGGAIDGFLNFITHLPVIDSFLVKFNYFAVAPFQLEGNSLTSGDIVVKGTSVTNVGFFEMLNTRDLDKDYILHTIDKEVKRITLERFLDDLQADISRAKDSDSSHLKTKDLMTEEKGDYMINKGR